MSNFLSKFFNPQLSRFNRLKYEIPRKGKAFSAYLRNIYPPQPTHQPHGKKDLTIYRRKKALRNADCGEDTYLQETTYAHRNASPHPVGVIPPLFGRKHSAIPCSAAPSHHAHTTPPHAHSASHHAYCTAPLQPTKGQ
jgi:hypothetical protein